MFYSDSYTTGLVHPKISPCERGFSCGISIL